MSKLSLKNSYPTTETATHLNVLLATLANFYFTYKHYHWNLVNSDFYEYHKLFDSHASTIYETLDQTAERIRQMGEKVTGEIADYTKNTLLKNRLADENDLLTTLTYLVECHDKTIELLETIIKHTSEINDFSTADLLTGFLQEHQQMRWFIAASNVK